MKTTLLVLLFALSGTLLKAQNWNAYPPGSLGVPYVNGLMTATVTRVNTTMNSGTPMFTTSTSPDCYIAAGCLALNAGFFNSYIANSSRIQVDLDFTTGGTAGMCNSATFTIRDINSGESFTDFLDVVEISGIDGNNAALPAANIVVTPPANTNVTTVGNSKKIVGHNSSSEVVTGGPYSSTPCNVTTITVSPPANIPLKSIRIIYRPAVGTNSSNAYYSVGTRPAVQYISISNLTFTPTGGGCSVLSENLLAFGGVAADQGNTLAWTTAQNTSRGTFLLAKSLDAQIFSEMAVHVVAGEGQNEFLADDLLPAQLTYYRLSVVDEADVTTLLGMTAVDRQAAVQEIFTVYPNPAHGHVSLQTFGEGVHEMRLYDLAGQKLMQFTIDGAAQQLLELSDLPSGIYLIAAVYNGRSVTRKLFIAE